MKDDLNCTSWATGAQCVAQCTHGTLQMLLLCVANLVIQQLHVQQLQLSLGKEKGSSGWRE